MIERLKAYKRYFPLGIVAVVIGIVLMVAYKVISNSTDVVGVSWRYIGGFIDIISPVIYAFASAYLLYYPVQFIEKWITYGADFGMPKRNQEKSKGWIRLISVATVFLMVIAIIGMLINFILPPLFENINILFNSIPKFEAQFNMWMKEIGNVLNSLNLEEVNAAIPGDVFNYVKDFLISSGQWVIG
ncbi:MAG: hypothetical protein RR627_05965, partial [Niameybacter sp.]